MIHRLVCFLFLETPHTRHGGGGCGLSLALAALSRSRCPVTHSPFSPLGVVGGARLQVEEPGKGANNGRVGISFPFYICKIIIKNKCNLNLLG